MIQDDTTVPGRPERVFPSPFDFRMIAVVVAQRKRNAKQWGRDGLTFLRPVGRHRRQRDDDAARSNKHLRQQHRCNTHVRGKNTACCGSHITCLFFGAVRRLPLLAFESSRHEHPSVESVVVYVLNDTRGMMLHHLHVNVSHTCNGVSYIAQSHRRVRIHLLILCS